MLEPTDPPRLRIRKNPLLKPPTKLSDPHRLIQKASKREFIHALEVANAARELGKLPDRDEIIHCVMRGNFHGWDLVPAILRLAAQPIETLYLATLGFNQRNAAEMLRLIDDGQIGALTLVCANYMRDASAETFQTLANGLHERGQRIAAARNHAKVIAAKLPDGRAYVVESSANLRSCHNIEQFTLTESPALFDFHVWWIDRVIQISNSQAEA